MADAQLAEEELQQSVAVSEGDFERESSIHADPRTHVGMEQLTQGTASHSLVGDARPQEGVQKSIIDSDTAVDYPSPDVAGLEDDAEGGADLEDLNDASPTPPASDQSSLLDDTSHGSSNDSGDGDSENDDDEGVGAVKIKPSGRKAEEDEDDGDDHDVDDAEAFGREEGEENEGDDQDDEENDDISDSEHTPSQSNSSEESDVEPTWQDAPEGDDEEYEEQTSNICMFCKQDEEHDPGEDFEESLTCSMCGEYSHQPCARDAGLVDNVHDFSQWKCPECLHVSSGRAHHEEFMTTEAESPGALYSTAVPDLSDFRRDKVTESDSAQSNSSRLDANGDFQDGSRLLRKRRTSPVGLEETPMSLRKRPRRALSDQASSNAKSSLALGSVAAGSDEHRVLRLKTAARGQSKVSLSKGSRRMMLKIRVDPLALGQIMVRSGNAGRKRSARPDPSRSSRATHQSLASPFVSSGLCQPFYSFLDRENDELKSRPYGGILDHVEADTSKTLPINDDRKRFDEAKQKAEEEWRALHAVELAVDAQEKGKRLKKTPGPASQIECIEFGGWEIDTWYAAPYPEEYSRNRILYICEFCLKYMNSDYVAWRHKLKCPAKHPPGDEIYRHGSISVFEVDGRKNPVYCQNLCLLAKLFLGSKTLYYDVEPFLFYVLCEYDDLGYHFVGYFSKEKRASSQNNVSCILTLPIHQRKGYGNLLIDFSYLLTRVENKTGSPEKPLSDMGLVSYRNYWRLQMCRYLLGRWHDARDKQIPPGLSLRQISNDTGLTPDDVVAALEGLRCLVRDTGTGLYGFRLDLEYCRDYVSKWDAKGYVKLNPSALTWTPYVVGRGNATNFELGPAITTIAPREEEEDRKPLQDIGHPPPGQPSGGKAPGLHESMTHGSQADSESAKLMASQASSRVCEGELQSQIRQSTEPRDSSLHGEDRLPHQQTSATGECMSQPNPKDWAEWYAAVPASRFEVFPPQTSRKFDRQRPTVVRPAMLRPPTSNPRPKRPAGASIRRPTASRPKPNSSSRRKTGGTGRGPGRWPKGTKKSDYGNADSGPGFPPGWAEEKRKVSELKAHNQVEEGLVVNPGDPQAMDTVRVQFHSTAALGGSYGLSDVQSPDSVAAAIN